MSKDHGKSGHERQGGESGSGGLAQRIDRLAALVAEGVLAVVHNTAATKRIEGKLDALIELVKHGPPRDRRAVAWHVGTPIEED
jgi:hypothetical protein